MEDCFSRKISERTSADYFYSELADPLAYRVAESRRKVWETISSWEKHLYDGLTRLLSDAKKWSIQQKNNNIVMEISREYKIFLLVVGHMKECRFEYIFLGFIIQIIWGNDIKWTIIFIIYENCWKMQTLMKYCDMSLLFACRAKPCLWNSFA